MRHRALNFLLGFGSVVVATGCLVGALSLLKSHDIQTDLIIQQKYDELEQRMDSLKDDYRKITKAMGFNVLILPAKQDLSRMWTDDFASEYMPEEYVTKLAESKVMTVRHLLPSLQQRIFWPEQKRDIILVGIRGEIPLLHRRARSPILKPVGPGTAVVGHVLSSELSIEAGGTLTLLGREFKVTECLEQRGSKDDITIWISLAEAQQMLNKPGLINGIWALECLCAWADLAKVREEITNVLKDTQVVEKAGIAIARAEARRRAADEADALIEMEKQDRRRMRAEKERLAGILIPIVVFVSGLWIGVMALLNVRDRRSEVGILRAVGARSRQIMLVFLGRAFVLGFAGGLVGYFAGTVAVSRWSVAPWWSPGIFTLSIAGASFLSCVASWIPALLAANQDPAEVLREE
jgi:hypothetical protein